jgi:hypothetical protein
MLAVATCLVLSPTLASIISRAVRVRASRSIILERAIRRRTIMSLRIAASGRGGCAGRNARGGSERRLVLLSRRLLVIIAVPLRRVRVVPARRTRRRWTIALWTLAWRVGVLTIRWRHSGGIEAGVRRVTGVRSGRRCPVASRGHSGGWMRVHWGVAWRSMCRGRRFRIGIVPRATR